MQLLDLFLFFQIFIKMAFQTVLQNECVSLFLDRKTKCNVQMRQFVVNFTITELLKRVQQMLIIYKTNNLTNKVVFTLGTNYRAVNNLVF